jgi:hypothetical protein
MEKVPSFSALGTGSDILIEGYSRMQSRMSKLIKDMALTRNEKRRLGKIGIVRRC